MSEIAECTRTSEAKHLWKQLICNTAVFMWHILGIHSENELRGAQYWPNTCGTTAVTCSWPRTRLPRTSCLASFWGCKRPESLAFNVGTRLLQFIWENIPICRQMSDYKPEPFERLRVCGWQDATALWSPILAFSQIFLQQATTMAYFM